MLSRGESHVAGGRPEAQFYTLCPSFQNAVLSSRSTAISLATSALCPRCRWLVPFPFSDRGSPGKRKPGKCQPLKTGFSDKLTLLLYL